MKVAILNEKYSPYVSGGAEKSVEILADALAGRGVEPEVVTLCPDSAGRTEREDGIRVHYLAARNFFWPFDGRDRARWKIGCTTRAMRSTCRWRTPSPARSTECAWTSSTPTT